MNSPNSDSSDDSIKTVESYSSAFLLKALQPEDKLHLRDNKRRGDGTSLSSASSTTTTTSSSSTSTNTKKDTPRDRHSKYLLKRGFCVNEKVGEGGYSRVYRASSVSSSLLLVVKIIDIRSENREKRVKFIKREISALQTLKHPNIVQMIDVFKTPKAAFILMEHLINGTISSYVREKGPVSENTAKLWTWQVVDAVVYMQRQGWVHRDIKTENMGLDHNMDAKLIDFGFSRKLRDPVTGESILSDTRCGTICYIAPEVLSAVLSTSSYSLPKVDVWAIGVALYIMLVRRLPFHPKNLQVICKQQLEEDWIKKRVYSILSNEAFDLLRGLLNPDPERRLSPSGILSHPWLQDLAIHFLTKQTSCLNISSQ